MKKLTLLAAVAVGYVLGTRAGRERYEQIKTQAEHLWHTDPVQSGVDHAKSAAADAAQKVAETAKDTTETVVEKIKSAGDIAAEADAQESPAATEPIRTVPVQDAPVQDGPAQGGPAATESTESEPPQA